MGDKIRLCRVVAGRAHHPYPICIGEACRHHRSDGKCSIDPAPGDHWASDAWVIEVAREQFRTNDYFG